MRNVCGFIYCPMDNISNIENVVRLTMLRNNGAYARDIPELKPQSFFHSHYSTYTFISILLYAEVDQLPHQSVIFSDLYS